MASDNILGLKRDTTTGALIVNGISDRDNGQAGMYGASYPFQPTVLALTGGRVYFTRFVPSRDMTIVNIAFCVTTIAGVSDDIDVGIFNAALTTKLVSKGATAGQLGTLGVKPQTVAATALSAGTVYHACFSVGAAVTLAQVAATGLPSGNVADLFGTAAGIREQGFGTAHPLAAPITVGGSLAGSPLLVLRES